MEKITMISLLVDGKSIQVEPGTTVMEAALRNGIEVPHLCYHPELSVSGGCRLCVVEVEGRPRPTPSCELACQEGMAVFTQSPC
jgi:NADH dehydrogenase/NADH:ubiquinone oxidoreductase subunit G